MREPPTDPDKSVFLCRKTMLQLHLEAGVDETLVDVPVDRFATAVNAAVAGATGPEHADPARPSIKPINSSEMREDPLLAGDGGIAASARAAASAALSLTDLRQALETFDGCVLKQTAKSLVFGDGNPGAAVMLIGEAPGADEDREGIPFVGMSGQLLDRMFASIGLDRSSVYITNIVPWRPPGNRVPTPVETSACLPFIQRHIELIAPRVLVLIGGTAAKPMLGRKEGIMRLRGRWLAYPSEEGVSDPIPTLATFHPAFLLRSPAQKSNAWKDLLMIRQKLSEIFEKPG